MPISFVAAIPGEIEAQVEDLLDGREASAGLVPVRFLPPPGAAPATNTPGIKSLLVDAAGALLEGRCDDYYGQYMSPTFRRETSAKALATLVRSCERSDSLRETLIAALHIVQDSAPAFDRGGNRATYDTTGRGLPFERFVLERQGDRWYIAE